MHFTGLEIAAAGTSIGLEGPRAISRGAAPHGRNSNLSLHPIAQELMARQQYLVDTLHPAGFL